ncbi:ferric siderophore transport system, periplasmic binding protein TonB [Lachnospiraceae bacterium KM106-2]|nr:ferric siderophore transport system, periplasmic binding protein TonB [Lachnospiraceae bacterium KM106-2]
MKQKIALLLVVVLMLSILPIQTVSVSAAPAGIAINTEEDLRNMSMKGSYYLANDIEITKGWTTLGSFSGNLDGNGYVIKNLNITTPQDDGYGVKLYGLFREIGSGGKVVNLGIEGSIHVPELKDAVGVSAGLLAGIISNDYYGNGEERIKNCYVKGEITSAATMKQQSLGGLAGIYDKGIGRYCYSAVKGVDIFGNSTIVNLKHFYTNTSLYEGELQKDTIGKTTKEMQSEQFLAVLNQDQTGIVWIKGEDGYPKLTMKQETPEEEVTTQYISTEEELRAIKNDMGGHYVLTNHIELTKNWDVIGNKDLPFTGVLDGNGYEIRNFKLKYTGKEFLVGMFAVSSGTIKNIGIKGDVECNAFPTDIGFLTGVNKGTIENSYAIGTLSPSWAYRSGLLAGDNQNGKITNCYVSGTSKRNYAVAMGNASNGSYVYYDRNVFNKDAYENFATAKTTEEMQSEPFVTLLNANRGKNKKWYQNEGGYPVLRKPKVEVTVDVDQLKDQIADMYLDDADPFVIIDMTAYGKVDSLTAKEQLVQNTVELLMTKDSSNYSTDLEKHIIALSAIGVDAANIQYQGKWYDAIEELGQIDMEDELVNSLIFALNAYESGQYREHEKALQSKEEILKLLLAEQKSDGGFSFMGRTGDVDMTAMAVHALSTYYFAENADSALVNAVEKAINFLSTEQREGGAYASGDNDNSNSASMVIVALSALGIDADTDPRFCKDGTSALEALLAYAMSDHSGFKWKESDTKANAMATEQGFRALVAYQEMKKAKKAFNIYSFGMVRTERPVTEPQLKPEPEVKPSPEMKPEPEDDPEQEENQEPQVKPETDVTPEAEKTPMPEPTPEQMVTPVPEKQPAKEESQKKEESTESNGNLTVPKSEPTLTQKPVIEQVSHNTTSPNNILSEVSETEEENQNREETIDAISEEHTPKKDNSGNDKKATVIRQQQSVQKKTPFSTPMKVAVTTVGVSSVSGGLYFTLRKRKIKFW